MSKELEAYDIVFNNFNNCTCQDGRFPIRSALDTIYQALKRNEPMAAIYTRFTHVKTEDFWYEPTCPNCKSLVLDEDKFCRECGQKLDWSDGK